MKNLSKLCIFTVPVLLPSILMAQTVTIKAGLTLSDMLMKKSELYVPYEYSGDEKTKINPGFHVGVAAGLPVFNLFSIEAGLNFSTRGTNLTKEEPFGSTTLVTKGKYSLYFLELPVVAKVTFKIKGFDLFGFAGGYGALGISGKIKTSYTFGDLEETETASIKWGSESGVSDLKRFDYGVLFGAGMNWKSFQFGLTYNLGLGNLSPEADLGAKTANRGFSVSLGYVLNLSGQKEQPKVKVEKSKQESTKVVEPKSEKTGKKKAAEIEAERQIKEKMTADSIAAAKAEAERLRIAKVKADSIETARAAAIKAEAERVRLEKAKTDSIAAAQNAAKVVIYRIQFASNATKKGSYDLKIAGKTYKTWEYLYSGAYRSTVGEFRTFAEAAAFQRVVRQSGYPQAFVVAFKNNTRVTDPSLFK